MRMGVYRTPAQKMMIAGQGLVGLLLVYLFVTSTGGSSGKGDEGASSAGSKQGALKAASGGTDATPWDAKSMKRKMNVLITGGAG